MQLKHVKQQATFWTHFNPVCTPAFSLRLFNTWRKTLRIHKKTSAGRELQTCVMKGICWFYWSLSPGSLFMLILFTLVSVSSPTSHRGFLPRLFPPIPLQQFSPFKQRFIHPAARTNEQQQLDFLQVSVSLGDFSC